MGSGSSKGNKDKEEPRRERPVDDDAFSDTSSLPPDADPFTLLVGEESACRLGLEEEWMVCWEENEYDYLESTYALLHDQIETDAFEDGPEAIAAEEERQRQGVREEMERQEVLVCFEVNLDTLVRTWADSRKGVEKAQYSAFEAIRRATALALGDVNSLVVESQAALMIQKNYRMVAAIRYAHKVRFLTRHTKIVQRFSRCRSAQLHMRLKEAQLYELYELQREELDERRHIISSEKKDTHTLSRALKLGYDMSKKRELTRLRAEREEGERRSAEDEEARGRTQLYTAELEDLNEIETPFFTELHRMQEEERSAREAEERRKAAEFFREQHDSERKELLDEEGAASTALVKEEQDAWEWLAIKITTSKTKTEHKTMARLLREHHGQKQEIVQEEEVARPIWVSQEAAEWETFWAYRLKEYAKAIERHRLREEIERLRVEQEYEYVRNLFILLNEEEEWDALENEGLAERKDIQEKEWNILMDKQAHERELYCDAEPGPREEIEEDEESERMKLYRFFTRHFMRMPYEQELEALNICHEPGLFQNPPEGETAEHFFMNSILGAAPGGDRTFSTCWNQGTVRLAQSVSPKQSGTYAADSSPHPPSSAPETSRDRSPSGIGRKGVSFSQTADAASPATRSPRPPPKRNGPKRPGGVLPALNQPVKMINLPRFDIGPLDQRPPSQSDTRPPLPSRWRTQKPQKAHTPVPVDAF